MSKVASIGDGVRLACGLGYFELHDARSAPPPRRWGCPEAESWADAQLGLRLRYETLVPTTPREASRGQCVTDSAGLVIRGGWATELPEPDPATHPCAARAGRWLALPSGVLAVSDGHDSRELQLSPGPVRVRWYPRTDVALYETRSSGVSPAGPHHELRIEPLAGDPPPAADMIREAAIYAEWHAIQRTTDPGELVDALEADDPDGWRRHAVLARLHRAGATEALDRIARRAPLDLLALSARALLAGASSVVAPPTLDGLPEPVHFDIETHRP